MAERKEKLDEKDAARMQRLFGERDAATEQFNTSNKQIKIADQQRAVAKIRVASLNIAIDTIAQDYLEEGEVRKMYDLEAKELIIVTPEPKEETPDAGDGES